MPKSTRFCALVQFQNPNYSYFHYISLHYIACLWLMLEDEQFFDAVWEDVTVSKAQIWQCVRGWRARPPAVEESGGGGGGYLPALTQHSSSMKDYSCGPCIRKVCFSQPFLLRNHGDMTFQHGFIGVCICILWRPNSSTSTPNPSCVFNAFVSRCFLCQSLLFVSFVFFFLLHAPLQQPRMNQKYMFLNWLKHKNIQMCAFSPQIH